MLFRKGMLKGTIFPSVCAPGGMGATRWLIAVVLASALTAPGAALESPRDLRAGHPTRARVPLAPAGPGRAGRALRGGGEVTEGADAVAKWGLLSSWLSARWDEIPTEQRGRLREFAVRMVHDKAGIAPTSPLVQAESPAIRVAMMLLGLRVAMRMLPQWSELWARLDKILRSATEGEGYAAVSTAVQEAACTYWSRVLDASVSVDAIECPSPGVVRVKGLVIGNPRSGHFSRACEAVRIESVQINLNAQASSARLQVSSYARSRARTHTHT